MNIEYSDSELNVRSTKGIYATLNNIKLYILDSPNS